MLQFLSYSQHHTTVLDFFPIFRAMDIQTLVGNAGGYIGLFLGYSFLQIPQAFLGIRRYFQKRHQKDQRKKNMRAPLMVLRIKKTLKRPEDR